MKIVKCAIVPLLFFALFCSFDARAQSEESSMQVTVKVIMEKLPIIKREKMADLEEKVQRYVNEKKWFAENDLPPFKVAIQLYLEDQPSNIEDRYRCSILVSGPDVQYYDRYAVFPFQEGETIVDDGQYTPLKGLIDFYVYLVIAGEYDKIGYLEGSLYFDKAKAVMGQGKFTRSPYFTGWDRREDFMQKVYSKNYTKFREMKDYYFYGLDYMSEDKKKAKQYIVKAMEMLQEVLDTDRDLEAAKKFIDAHYQEVIDIFKKDKNKKAIEILLELDPDRRDVYESALE